MSRSSRFRRSTKLTRGYSSRMLNIGSRSIWHPSNPSKAMNKHFRVSGSTFSKLEELGVSASEVLRSAGLSQGLLGQPRVLLTTKELFALWRAIGEVSNNPAIGLQL